MSSAEERPYSQLASPQYPATGLAASAGKKQFNNSLFKLQPSSTNSQGAQNIVEDEEATVYNAQKGKNRLMYSNSQ